MQKKMIAMAVAGVFAAPAAFAQVTVSGKLGIQLTNIRVSDAGAARAGLNQSTTILNDNASIIRIGAREALGGGLEAFGQYEIRPNLDGSNSGQTAALPVGSTTGVSFVGLRSNAWGSLRAGTLGTWGEGTSAYGGYGVSPGASQHYSLSGMSNYIMLGGTTKSFSASRQPNVIMYETPRMGGFVASLAWSSAPLTTDQDMNVAGRKGQAWYVMPAYFFNNNMSIGYAYADIKDEATPAANTPIDLKAHKIYGQFNIAGFEFAPGYAKVKAKQGIGFGAVAAGTDLADTKKWWLPIRYKVGNNVFGFMYMKNADDKIQAGDQGATQISLAYNYNFSSRTNAGISWIRLRNNAAAAFDVTSLTSNGYGATGASLNLGEDMNVIALSLNHNF